MSAASVTCRRTLGLLRASAVTGFAVAGFAAAALARYVFALASAEGTVSTAIAVLAGAIAPFLPVLAAFLTMDGFSEERRTGRLDLLLSAPVRERELVTGVFTGSFVALVAAVVLVFALAFAGTRAFAPSALKDFSLLACAPAFLILALQGAAWCAVGVMLSAFSTRAAAAAVATAAFCGALPRVIWAAALAWAPEGAGAYGMMPLDAHVADFAAGSLSFGVAAAYLLTALAALFLASKSLAFRRLVGRGARHARASTAFAMILAVVAAILAAVVALRLDSGVELPHGDTLAVLSPRLKGLLAELPVRVEVTAFVGRTDPRFREATRLLRTLSRASARSGGATVRTRVVDPHWDFGEAERLVAAGAREGSIVFVSGSRRTSEPLTDALSERTLFSALRRVSSAVRARTVCWTSGHGEAALDDYGPWGLSDVARDLARAGYENRRLDLTAASALPPDCALVVVAGARDDFSRTELGLIDAYLRGGGRLLALLGASAQGGVAPLLPAWGLRAEPVTLVGAPTLSGTDVTVGDFSRHAVVSRLAGSRLVFEKPCGFSASSAAAGAAGADRLEYAPLASVGSATVAAVVERGVGAGKDLSLRPTRLVATGDASFILNGALEARGNANRDFFLNAVDFLAGLDASGASGTAANVLVTGLDRAGRLRFLLAAAVAAPLVLLAVLWLFSLPRRRRL